MGYCFFNNIAIAAQHAIDVHGCRKVAIVDWDVHHGNGTQRAFESRVMTQFIQMQMAQMQSSAARPVPVAPVPTSPPAKQTPAKTPPAQQTPVKPPATEQGDSEEAPKRRYKTGEDEATINAAIDAIMAHNDAQVLHDLKWAITINTLKAFSKNQRIIERILGKGKDNPDIDRIVGEREAEIEAHHQQHQIQPGHNNRHKRKRKVGDVIQV